MVIRHASLLLCLAAAVLASHAGAGQESESVTVFTPTEVGAKPRYGYRIPAIVSTHNATLLAFCERRIGFHDHAENDIVMKRSTDGGVTWQEVQVLAQDGGNSLNDPCAVVLDTGRILLRYKRYPQGVHQRKSSHTVMAEPGYGGPKNVKIYLTHSDDDGKTWSPSREVTKQMRRETSISVGSPGGAIQLTRGPHKGRIVFPNYEGIRISETERTFINSASFSDDGGKTWTLAAQIDDSPMGDVTGNEAQIVELSDGSILMSSRLFGPAMGRKFTRSTDGGMTWSEPRIYSEMETPQCMSSIIRYTTAGEEILLHSVPNTTDSRSNGTMFASQDQGKTWKKLLTIEAEEFAYSHLVNLPGGDVGCFYETDRGEDFKIVFKRISKATISAALRQIQ
jgi:sialidase-1